MDKADLDSEIQRKVKEKPWIFESERDEPISEEDLARIESKRSITLPLAFKRHLSTYGAGEFAFGTVYSPDSESGWSLWRDIELLGEYENDYIPFSDNGGGDYLAFFRKGSEVIDRVVWLDHEQGYKPVDSEYACFNDFVFRFCLNQE